MSVYSIVLNSLNSLNSLFTCLLKHAKLEVFYLFVVTLKDLIDHCTVHFRRYEAGNPRHGETVNTAGLLAGVESHTNHHGQKH